MLAIQKKHTWALKLFISSFIIAKLFTLMHWPEARVITLFSAVVLIVFYPLRYAAKQNRVLLDHVKMALVITYCINIFLHLEDFMPITVLQTILFFYWFINEGFFYFDFNLNFKKTNEREENILDDFEEKSFQKGYAPFVDILMILSVVLVLSSALFKTLNWPFASEMMLIGYSSFAVVIWFKEF